MNNMLMAVFDTAPQALKGVIDLNALHRAGDIKVFTTAVIAKDPSGAVSIKQASERRLRGFLFGLLTGILIGMLGGPVGLAIGGSIGGLIGLIFELAKAGISADFLEEASQALDPGKAALLAELDEISESLVDMKLMKLGGRVSRRPRTEFVDNQLIAEMDRIEAEVK